MTEPDVIRMKSFRMFVVVNSQDTIGNGYAFARKGDDAFDDELVANCCVSTASKFSVGFTVCENDDLAAFRNIFFTFKVGD